MTTSLRTESSQPERLLARLERAATPLGNGVIEFDPNAVSRTESTQMESRQTEAGPIERTVSNIAFIGLLIAVIYLVYQFVSQHFEPMLYVITHF